MKEKLLKKLDRLNTYLEKLNFLQLCFLNTTSAEAEKIILEMIEELKANKKLRGKQ
jgi:hypothetical protein